MTLALSSTCLARKVKQSTKRFLLGERLLGVDLVLSYVISRKVNRVSIVATMISRVAKDKGYRRDYFGVITRKSR